MSTFNGVYGFPGEKTVTVATAMDPAFDGTDNAVKMKSIHKKWRSDFSGLEINPEKWDVTQEGTGITVSVQEGLCAINMGTTHGDSITLLGREIFTLPCRLMVGFNLPTRIIDQEFWLELVSVDPQTGEPDGQNAVAWNLDGTSTSQARCGVQNGGTPLYLSAVGTTTSSASNVIFEIEAHIDQCWFHTRGMDSTSARSTPFLRDQQIPDANAYYKVRLRADNRRVQPVLNATSSGGLIRLNVTGHGYATGNTVLVENVRGVTNANGTWTITVVDTNTIQLDGSVFAGTFNNAGNAIPGVASQGAVQRLNINPASSTTWNLQWVMVSDYAELTAEITSGRGSTSAGQAMAVAVSSVPTTRIYNLNTHTATTTTNLAANGTYNTTATAAISLANDSNQNFAGVAVLVRHVAGLTPGTLIVDGFQASSTPSTTSHIELLRVPVPSSPSGDVAGHQFWVPMACRYYRIRFINGPTAQTSFAISHVQMVTNPDAPLVPPVLPFIFSNSALAANATFTGTALDFGTQQRLYKTLTAYAYSNVASAANGFRIEQSSNGTNWRTTAQIGASAGTVDVLTSELLFRYARVIYVNGASAQTDFDLGMNVKIS